MQYYIAIDGGGTKTEGVLAVADGSVIARAVVGPSNPNDTSVGDSAHTIVSLAESLMHEVMDPEADFYLYAGISGATSHQPELKHAISLRLPMLVAWDVGSDMQILLSAELPDGDGACIICGTGSACFLRKNQQIFRIGGWGYLLDSGGSGYDMGRDALEAALRAHDGRGEGTILTEMLAEKLGAPVWESITTIYQNGKPLIASCAPAVFEAAEHGDTVADCILTRNATALAEYIQTAFRKVVDGSETIATVPFRVIMGGGISQKQAPAWEARIARYVDSSILLDLRVASHPPVLGALLEAMRLNDPSNGQYETVCERFSDTYSRYL